MSWTDENEPTINNEPTNYEEFELAFTRLQKKYEENSGLLRLNNWKLDRLKEAMDNMLNEEQTTSKNYHSKTSKDIESGIKRQRTFLVPHTQERVQTMMDS